MRNNKAKVVGHPRSGSHYFTHLIAINFFDGRDHLQYYGGHVSTKEHHIKTNTTSRYFYIYRNIEDTMKSMFNMRKRFGLDEDSFEIFKERTMVDMFNPSLTVKILVNTGDKITVYTNVDSLFSRQNVTPSEYIAQHQKKWLEFVEKYENLMAVRYEDLIENFDDTMLKVAKYMGSDKTEFENTTDRIGWIPQDVKEI